MCMDSTIPRKRLADILLAIGEMEKKYGLRCANVFHAGDGNLHPLILFDANDPDQLHRCELFGADILETSVAMGGTVTGEHGVGVEKLDSMCVQFSPAERAQMLALKRAFDPAGTAQPRQGDPDAAALRRVRQDARQARPAAVPRAAALLSHCAMRRRRSRRRSASSTASATRTAQAARCASAAAARKDFYGERAAGRGARHARRSPASSSYEPSELVVTVRAGTPLAELEALLAEHGQCLPFEPPRFGAAARTVGGMVAAGLSGPARAAVGAVRDHVLGATLLNGRARC